MKMAAPRELSLEAICTFISENGGRVTNHDLVKYFKPFLTDPDSRVEARNKFKEYVNQCAVLRNEEGEKFLVLKKKYRYGNFSSSDTASSPPTSPGSYSSEMSFPSTPCHGPHSPVDFPGADSRDSPMRQPPPYRSPPPVFSSPSSPVSAPPPVLPSPSTPLSPSQIGIPMSEEQLRDSANSYPDEADCASAPPVPPRRKSSDKMKVENNKENIPDTMKRPRTLGAESVKSEGGNGNGDVDSDRKISVKEQMQKFNRIASENEASSASSRIFPGGIKKRSERAQQGAADDDDTASVTSLDSKSREWLVCSSQADYQALAKLVKDNPKLAKLRDPTNTSLHWAAKHGEENVVKLIAGAYRADVNARTNGGYTPLHIAMMYCHENIFNLLVTVYGADPNLRDWSGRKPRQYLTSTDTSVSADTFRKIKARKKQAEKDLGFLRIGSLNVRVKRTTEAVSNFLGVGNSQNQKIHKSWGSADNIKEVNNRQLMPPPQFPIKKRKSKRAQDFASRSMPSTPPAKNRTSASSAADSDSDTACGFDSNWQSTV